MNRKYCYPLQETRLQQKNYELDVQVKELEKSLKIQRKRRILRDGQTLFADRGDMKLVRRSEGKLPEDFFYFEKDYGTDRHAVVNKIMTWVSIGAVLGFFAALFRVIFQNRQDYAILLVYSLEGAVFASIIFGFLHLILSGGRARKDLPVILNASGTRMQMMTFMERFYPDFSYDVFLQRMLYMLIEIIYSSDRSKLDYMEQPVLEKEIDDILDSTFLGIVNLSGYQCRGTNCTFKMDIYVENIYDYGKRPVVKQDTFRMQIEKDCSVSEEMGWMVKALWRR